jgi:DNA-binding beta-propeller fold protein YncE
VRRPSLRAAVAGVAAVSGTFLTGFSMPGNAQAAQSAHAPSARDRPTQVIAGPPAILGGTTPQLSGQLWILAGKQTVRTLHSLNLVGGKLGHSVPVSANADSIVESASGILAVGLATATTGAVQFLNGSTAAPLATIPIGAPVSALAVGADASTFYALNGTSASRSVTVIDSLDDKAVSNIPVPLDTMAIAVDPTQQRLFALESNGNMEIVAIAGNQILSQYFVGKNPRQFVLSADGMKMYVLKGGGGIENIGVINTALERQLKALPAPGNAVDLQLSSDSSALYAFVGTSNFGNVQVFPLASAA